ncbi:gliding motility-associated protein GldE [Phocaeicola coprophilus]|nr:gliding motility-associated protein GldE [Phocaeicola coprophilus]
MDTDATFRQWAETFEQIILTPPQTGAWIILALSLLFLVLSAFISASEVSFVSLTNTDKEKLNASHAQADRIILTLLGDSERLKAAMLVAHTLTDVAFILLGNYFLMQSIHNAPSDAWLIVGNTVILVLLMLLFGEIIPRIHATQKPLAFCRKAARAMNFTYRLFRPIAGWMVTSSNYLQKLAGRDNAHNLSVDELSQALELTDQNDISEEQNMLRGIIRFGGETVKEVMTSRLDIVDLELNTPFPQVIRCIIDNGYSRIPVYQNSRDNIKGVLYIKDLLPYLDKGDNFHWQSLIRPPYFVPDTKMIDDLLREFQRQKIHIAIVVDEFGGTSGLITMEDIIEEIIGEINDEYDEDERTYAKLNDSTYVFEGKTSLSDFYKITHSQEADFEPMAGEADTLAGLLLELKGEFPSRHEKLTYRNFTFEVLEMDNRRILKIKVIITPTEETEPQKR